LPDYFYIALAIILLMVRAFLFGGRVSLFSEECAAI